MKLLQIYYNFDNVALVAPRCKYEVSSVDVKNLDLNCINYFDVIWFTIPYGIENETDMLNVLSIIEYSNPKNYIITIFKNSRLENKWFMYGIPFVDIDSINYATTYDKEIRIYNNIFKWDNNVKNRYQHLPKHKKQKCNETYKIPATLIREILQSI